MNELIGSIEDINISEISPSQCSLRSVMENVTELAHSIRRFGLLQPIVVRANKLNFEIIAGNRRLKACKVLRLKKISCHIVELDDKSAFEVALIENVQRNTLNPVEEGVAFKKYVYEFGWGGISELAHKISKSPSFVSRRIQLTNLPQNILDLISQTSINIATAEELLPVHDTEIQSMLTKLISNKHLSTRKVRKIVKDIRSQNPDADSIIHDLESSNYDMLSNIFDKAIIAIKISIQRMATMIEKVQDSWIIRDIIVQHMQMLRQQVDLLIKQKVKYKKHLCRLRTIH